MFLFSHLLFLPIIRGSTTRKRARGSLLGLYIEENRSNFATIYVPPLKSTIESTRKFRRPERRRVETASESKREGTQLRRLLCSRYGKRCITTNARKESRIEKGKLLRDATKIATKCGIVISGLVLRKETISLRDRTHSPVLTLYDSSYPSMYYIASAFIDINYILHDLALSSLESCGNL